MHAVSRRAWGLRLRRARGRLAKSNAGSPCGLPQVFTRSPPGIAFSKLNTQPIDASVYASPAASRRPTQDSRSGWSRFSFPVGLFHPLQHAGLSRRSNTTRLGFTYPESEGLPKLFRMPCGQRPLSSRVRGRFFASAGLGCGAARHPRGHDTWRASTGTSTIPGHAPPSAGRWS